MKDQINQPYQVVSCSECDGSGFVLSYPCSECEGIGSYLWDGKQLYYWQKAITPFILLNEKVLRYISLGINSVLLLFSATSVLLLFWRFYELNSIQKPLDLFSAEWRILFFWFGLLAVMLLVFRVSREQEKQKNIQRKGRDSIKEVSFIGQSWQELINRQDLKKINIFPYFTKESYHAISKSLLICRRYRHTSVKPVHLFISLLTFSEPQIVIGRLGLNGETLREKIRSMLYRLVTGKPPRYLNDGDIIKILLEAYGLAVVSKQKSVTNTELFEALVKRDENVSNILFDLGAEFNKIQNVVAWIRIRKQLRDNWLKFKRRALLRPKSTVNRAMTAVQTPLLDSMSQDITKLAQFGYLMPCIGREKEIDDLFAIMSGGTLKSAMLVGHQGVGKNTIVEGIAQLMVSEDVPDFLEDRRLVSLSVAKLVSGVGGAVAHERLQRIIYEIRRSGNIILYVPDIHNMVGITAGAQGGIDLAEAFGQLINQNNLIVLATTSPSAYSKIIEARSSLQGVFEKVEVNEVSGDEAIQIIESKTGAIEYKYQVFFSYDSIDQIVALSSRYLRERYLPEKALEILQEVAARVASRKGKNAIISGNDVALLISEKTNIPLADITEAESDKLLNLEAKIHERVIGQNEAVSLVATSLRRARAEMRDEKRTIVNLLFLGPTGVGKTELAKTVAETYFNNENNMIRLDMSEYQDANSVARLIGAPIGSSEYTAGFLTQAIRKNPFSLILLDEIEKAHPDILNIFLQVMDDGRLTDNNGRTVDFTNAIIIATSNAGSQFIQDQVRKGTSIDIIQRQLADNHLGKYFRPEFINRFDGVVVFKPLEISEVEKIAVLMLQKVETMLESKGMSLSVTPEAIRYLAQKGFSPEFGARPLRRTIQQLVQDPLAELIIKNSLSRRDVVIIGQNAEISVKKAEVI